MSPSQSSTAFVSTSSQSNVVESPPEPILITHEVIGSAGPDKRESEGIQKALDWLKDKRSADYGWDNDTHMVILAKEVNAHFLYKYYTNYVYILHFVAGHGKFLSA